MVMDKRENSTPSVECWIGRTDRSRAGMRPSVGGGDYDENDG
jgi:hypothetical protein